MNPPPAESKAWSRQRWVAMILLVLAGQVGCIFWLTSRKPNSLPPFGPASVLYLPEDQTADLPGVSDPTLFVMPNAHGFSGPAWIQFPAADYTLEPWTEPPLPLQLERGQLGATLRDFVQTNQSRPFELELKPEPQLESPGYVLPLEETPSSFSIEGGLADRQLLTPFVLKSWAAADVLTNTVVQIAVDAAGRVFSAALITRCALPEANTNALNLARSARFAPLRWTGAQPPPRDHLSWGRIVFRWQTTELPAITASANK